MPFDLRFYQPALSRIGRHLQLGMKLLRIAAFSFMRAAFTSGRLNFARVPFPTARVQQLRASVPADDNPSPGAPDQPAVPASVAVS